MKGVLTEIYSRTVSAAVLFFILTFFPASVSAQENTNDNSQENTSENSQDNSKEISQEQLNDKSREKLSADNENQEMDLPPLMEKDLFLDGYLHRFQIRMGLSYSRVSPFVLTEVSESWMINSAVRSLMDPGSQISVAYDSPDYIPMYGNHFTLAYSYRNRFTVELSRWETGAKFNRQDPTSVMFVSPETSMYYNSIYEGVRLLEYRKENLILRPEYLHPVLPWFRLGVSYSIVRFSETNVFTFGSFTRTKNSAVPPLESTWSAGGDLTQTFQYRDHVPGIAAKFFPAKWIEIHGRLEFINWKGSFDLSGFQALERTSGVTGNTDYPGLVSLFAGGIEEKGYRTQMEAIFYFCRFSLHVGLVREDLKRKYTSYYGKSYSPVSGISVKADGAGFGEMSKSRRHGSTEFYIEPSVSFHYN